MKKIILSAAPKVPINIEGYIMHSSSSLQVIHLCLHPGQEIEQHANDFDVVVCVIKGDISLNMGDNKTLLSLYDVAEVEKLTQRGFSNLGTTEARLLILKKM